MLLTNDTLLRVNAPGLWIDSLHVQIVGGLTQSPAVVAIWYTGSAFITNSVFQGDAVGQARGLVSGGSVMGPYVQGVNYESPRLYHLYLGLRPSKTILHALHDMGGMRM